MLDLTQVPIEDLIAEINRRTSSALVVYSNRIAVEDEMMEEEPTFSFNAGRFAAIGLAQWFVSQAVNPSMNVVFDEDGEILEGDEDDD